MNCRGDDGIDAKRSRPSIGKTRYKCHARLERAVLVGTRSADYIRASGHSGRIQRPYTWLHPTPFAEMPDFSLAPRAPSIHGTFLPCQPRRSMSGVRGIAAVTKKGRHGRV